MTETVDTLAGLKRLASKLEEKHKEVMKEMLTLFSGSGDDAVPAAANTTPDGERSDVDGIARYDVSPYGGAQATCNGLSSVKRAAKRLPSGSSGLDCVGITSDAGDAAERRSVNGIYCPCTP